MTEVDMDPSNYNCTDLREEIQEVEDAEWLEELLEAEKNGDDRKTARNWISDRIGAVTEDEQEEESSEDVESEPDGESGNEIGTVEVNPEDLSVSSCNERSGNAEADEDLVESIEKRGIDPRQRPLVRPDGDDSYEIVYGQRRVDGAIKAGLEEIEVDYEDLSDSEARLESIRENYSRGLGEEVSARDRSLSLWELWQEMGGEGFPSSTKLSEEIGASRSSITRWLEPLKPEWENSVIDPRVVHHEQESVNLEEIGESALSYIRKIPDSGATTEDRLELARRVAEGEETQSSVREVKQGVEEGVDLRVYLEQGDIEQDADEDSITEDETSGQDTEDDTGSSEEDEQDAEAGEEDDEGSGPSEPVFGGESDSDDSSGTERDIDTEGTSIPGHGGKSGDDLSPGETKEEEDSHQAAFARPESNPSEEQVEDMRANAQAVVEKLQYEDHDGKERAAELFQSYVAHFSASADWLRCPLCSETAAGGNLVYNCCGVSYETAQELSEVAYSNYLAENPELQGTEYEGQGSEERDWDSEEIETPDEEEIIEV